VSGPCAKRRVWSFLLLDNGVGFWGNNDCRTPQLVCPRDDGDGYDKCQTVCQQDRHAETMAIRKACDSGFPLRAAHMWIMGHTPCTFCQAAMDKHGITWEAIP
jgi:tRNA(Arg) A34 adenosine deaminase TadA